MLMIDQLRTSDPPLRTVAIGILSGMGILLVGLWYMQVMAHRRFARDLANQSLRAVRLPGLRGKILDRNGKALADNRLSFNINLYLEEMRPAFAAQYTNQVLKAYRQQNPGRTLSLAEKTQLQREARHQTVSNVVLQVGAIVQQPLPWDEGKFQQHYTNKLYLPLPVVENLSTYQVALFAEKAGRYPGLELETQPVRCYPFQTTAAHLLGHLKRMPNDEAEDEGFFHYRLPDYLGEVGIEGWFDTDLRGRAGMKSLLVNSLGYRMSDQIVAAPEPGKNVVLTLDLALQQAAERALQAYGPQTRGAAVVLDVCNGDILALASAPAFDPNLFLGRILPEQMAELADENLTPWVNRATSGIYAPGSIFKIIVTLACLEAGTLDPNEPFLSPGSYPIRGRPPIKDTAPAGEYDLRRAFLKSSNTYFIKHGLEAGLEHILEMGKRFHLGERSNLPTRQDQKGFFPSREWLQKQRRGGLVWGDGHTANLCIGQGEIAVTPLQMAMMTAAIANGGKVFWPRLVQRVEPYAPGEEPTATVAYPAGQVRGELGVRPQNLEIIRQIMRADVGDPEGTGREAEVPGLNVCGKTGTAEVTQGRTIVDKNTWFVSFAPLESPRYAVVIMIESGGSGGRTCAPVARRIYQAIRDLEQNRPPHPPDHLADAD
jgi:penicillin-binding protein 2